MPLCYKYMSFIKYTWMKVISMENIFWKKILPIANYPKHTVEVKYIKGKKYQDTQHTFFYKCKLCV